MFSVTLELASGSASECSWPWSGLVSAGVCPLRFLEPGVPSVSGSDSEGSVLLGAVLTMVRRRFFFIGFCKSEMGVGAER